MIGNRQDTVPDLIHPIIGYRRWKIRKGKLTSPFVHDNEWEIATNTAYCKHVDHPAPSRFCQCGLYAFHNFEPIDVHLSSPLNWTIGEVEGACLMWGSVEVHSEGVRSEFASPLVLSLPTINFSFFEKLILTLLFAHYFIPFSSNKIIKRTLTGLFMCAALPQLIELGLSGHKCLLLFKFSRQHHLRITSRKRLEEYAKKFGTPVPDIYFPDQSTHK